MRNSIAAISVIVLLSCVFAIAGDDTPEWIGDPAKPKKPSKNLKVSTTQPKKDEVKVPNDVDWRRDFLKGLDWGMHGDDFVGVDDLNIILANWGDTVPVGDFSQGDVSGPSGVSDGFVGSEDLNAVLIDWGKTTQ